MIGTLAIAFVILSIVLQTILAFGIDRSYRIFFVIYLFLFTTAMTYINYADFSPEDSIALTALFSSSFYLLRQLILCVK